MMLRAGRMRRWREGRGRAFYPPLDTPFAVRLAWRFLSRILWKTARVREVSIVGIERLEAIKGAAGVLAPNHPTNLDPVVLFELSKQLGEPFNYLASRESFSVPGVGWVLQRCGAYSIMRGAVDRAAIKTTRSLLTSGRKIVMFPEGLTYGQNDTLMPFHEGVAQFGFWALQDMEGAGPLWYVPIGLKYRFMKPMDAEISLAVWRLEKHIGIPVDLSVPVYDRLRAVGTRVVEGYEKAYGVRPDAADTLDERIQRMKNLWVARAAAVLGIEDNASLPLGDRIRAIVNALDRMAIAEDASEFTKETMRRRHAETQPLYKDLERAGRFLATGASYVAERPTDERFLEVIGRMEEELFGFSPPRGPRRAVLVVGEPVDVSLLFSAYQSNPRGTVTEFTRGLEDAVRGLITVPPP